MAALVLAACAAQRALEPIEPPAAAAFDPALVEKGAALAALANCGVCHTAPGGRPYAGGRKLETPFGTFYTKNITPDASGIGGWSEAAFRRALHEGLGRDGRHLYPAFPYEYFTRVSDEDIRALYAYVMTRPPVRAAPPPHELRFPFNLRALLGAWKALFFVPDDISLKDRGAYLSHGLAHCGACHTPRSALGVEQREQLFAGGEAEGWHAPALDATNPAPVPWTAETLTEYLRTGISARHPIAAGPMAPVVESLARAPQADVRAIAEYFAARMASRAPRKIEEAPDPGGATASLYAGACGVCHDRGRGPSSASGLPLGLATAVTIPTARNLVRITLEGIAPGPAGRSMPGFAGALTDAQVASLMHYIRARFGGGAPPWTDVDEAIRQTRNAR